jgi:2-keto-3-deoxy-L-rhamnonate aldolase RhmA
MAAFGQQMPFTDERLREPITKIIEVAHSKGIPVGLPLLSMDAVRYFNELGLDWFTSGMDMLWVAAGAPRTLQETRQVLEGAAAPAS